MSENNTEARLKILEIGQDTTNKAIVSIEQSLVKLVRLEERHAETRDAIGRAFAHMEKQDGRIDAQDKRLQLVEQKLPGLTEARTWLVAGMLGCLGLLGIAVVSLVTNTREDRASHYIAPPPAETRPRPDR